MAKKIPMACSECSRILDDDQEQCSTCPDAPCTTDWQGYVIIIDPARSVIAGRLGAKRAGNYALKVNLR